MEIQVHTRNRTALPRTVSEEEVIEKVEEMDLYPGMPPETAVNRALAEFGSFDPQSEEYREFESSVADSLLSN